jgi:hypothetical protein
MCDSDFELFSSDSDNDGFNNSKSHTKNLKPVQVGGNNSNNTKSKSIKSDNENDNESDDEIDDAQILSDYKLISLSDVENIEHNTQICYYKSNNKLIFNKFFKNYDIIKKSVKIGFSKSDKYIATASFKTMYYVNIDDIKEIYIHKSCTLMGGSISNDPKLKDTIEIKKKDWGNLSPDTVISYQKKDDSIIYNAKFNSYISDKKSDEMKFALSTAAGFAYRINPKNIKAIYRHVTAKDKTMIQLFTKIELLEKRIAKLENLKQ